MPRVVAVLRARLARPAAQQVGPASRVADPARLVAKAELRPVPAQPVAALPGGPRPAAERVREVVLQPAVKSVQEVLPPRVAEHVPEVALRQAGKPELRLALAPPAAIPGGPRPAAERVREVVLHPAVKSVQEVLPPRVAEHVLEVALPLVVERAPEVLPPLAEAHAQEAARQQVEARDARQEAVVRVQAAVPLQAAGEPDEQPRVVAQQAAQAWAEEQLLAVSQAAPPLASRARLPGPVQHVPA